MNVDFRFHQLLLVVLSLLIGHLFVLANPSSKPYIPFRTNPFDPASGQHHELIWDNVVLTRSSVRHYQPESATTEKEKCPFRFSLGVTSSSSSGTSTITLNGADHPIVSATAKALGIVQPPVIFPIHPSLGPGRQVLYTTQYEHLDLLSPITVTRSGKSGGTAKKDDAAVIKEGLAQLPDFPLLFESSSFLTSPLVHDVNGDGIPDAILTDYDGGIYMIGLYAKPGTKRYFHRAQVPRLFVRRNWVEERLKETAPNASLSEEVKNDTHDARPRDPFHSYFEYVYVDGNKAKGDILQGVPANVLGQDTADVKGLTERRSRLAKLDKKSDAEHDHDPQEHEHEHDGEDHADEHHRRLQGEIQSNNKADTDVKQPKSQIMHAVTDGLGVAGGTGQLLEMQGEPPKLEPKGEAPKLDPVADLQHGEQQQQNVETPKQEQEIVSKNQVAQVEAPKQDPQAQVPKQEKDTDTKKQEPVVPATKQEPELSDPKQQAPRGGASSAAELSTQVPETGATTRQDQEVGAQKQKAETVTQQQEQKAEPPKQEQNADAPKQEQKADAPKQEQNAAPKQEQKVEPPKQEQGSETRQQQREVLGADEKGVVVETDAHQEVPPKVVAQQQVPETDAPKKPAENENQIVVPESEINQIPQVVAVDSAAKDPKIDDLAWEQIRGGEGGDGNIDDPDAGQIDPAHKSKDLGDDYRRNPKDDEVRAYGGYDDYYGERMGRVRERESYYDDKHYVRIPPHILATPVIVEVPKLYDANNAMEEMLILPVTYYLDEDEYDGLFSYKRFEHTDHGDETEVKRGMYVASALMVYTLGDSPRWGRQEHLDLSSDYSAPENATLMQGYQLLEDRTGMGAFALSTPTVADIDGDGNLDIIMATSMGMVYCLDVRHLYSREGWPIQMQRPVESRILVEDVLGDTNLEVFIADVGGNVVCLDHKANKVWHRNLPKSLGIDGTDVISFSPMTLGDVDGDGNLDVVLALGIKDASHSETVYVFALSAASGVDIPNFPIAFKPKKSTEEMHANDATNKRIPQPLLVDLHGDQNHIKSYLYRNGTTWTKRPQPSSGSVPHGGKAAGLHIVAPFGSTLYIIEAGSGCIQNIEIGDTIAAMVQADDVHGTNSLDLVVSTTSGNIITLESSSPFHPLNTWNHGEVRGSKNSFAHGYSASQGVFVHEASRQFRDIFGIYVPVTFEIFDNRPGIALEPAKRLYQVEVRDGTSSLRPILRKSYDAIGVYTERVYIPYGPGFYTLTVVLKTSHGLIYEDSFHLGYNVHYMDGFGILLWLPLVAAALSIVVCGRKKGHWDDDDFGTTERSGHSLGILGRATLPTSS